MNHEKNINMTTTDIIPLGSITKSFTAMGIIRLIEAGEMNFNDTVASRVDKILMSSNGTTLLKMWKGDERINKITLYQVLHMEAGFGDYDDVAVTLWALQHPNRNLDPLDYLYMIAGKFYCEPGTCEYYSTSSYILLGLALA